MFLCFAEQITSVRGYIKKASVCFCVVYGSCVVECAVDDLSVRQRCLFLFSLVLCFVI